MPNGIQLIDAQEMHRQAASFEVPTAAELDAIRAGDYVQAGFEDATGLERMWIKVLGVEGDRLMGTLSNNPVEIPMRHGDPVNLEKRHVYAIDNRGTSNSAGVIPHTHTEA